MASRSFVNKSIRGFGSIVVFGVLFLWHALKFIAFHSSAARTPLHRPTDDSKLNTGILNYRTGCLDDGTDPYGWY